jgi:flagellar motor component MotA
VETFLLLPLEVGAVASLVVRLRRSDGVERQQVKWLAYAMVVTVVGGTLTYVLYDVATVPWWLGWAG